MQRELPHLTDHQLGPLRKRLAQRAQVLLAEISAGLHSGGLEVDAHEPETGDVEAAVTAASAERDAAELRLVQAALARMQAGTYGRCDACGSALPWTRLDAEPEAPRCVACESARERGSPLHASL